MRSTCSFTSCNLSCFFYVLQAYGRPLRQSMIVATLFAIHPLRVESVAWIAERKDVLSGLLIVCNLWSYERYVRQPSRKNYAVRPAGLRSCLQAKPMAVIIPLLMMNLDYWPLQRFASRKNCRSSRFRYAWRGLPIIGSERAGALDMAGPLALDHRVRNAIYSLGRIMSTDTFIPINLAIVYPYRNPVPLVLPMACCDSRLPASPYGSGSRRPWLLAGWLWFVIGLAPDAWFDPGRCTGARRPVYLHSANRPIDCGSFGRRMNSYRSASFRRACDGHCVYCICRHGSRLRHGTIAKPCSLMLSHTHPTTGLRN